MMGSRSLKFLAGVCAAAALVFSACLEAHSPTCSAQPGSCPDGFACRAGMCVEIVASTDASEPDSGDETLDAANASDDAGPETDAAASDAAGSDLDAGPAPDADADTSPDVGGMIDAGPNLCAGVTCSGHGACEVINGAARCVCEAGYHTEQLECLPDFPAPTADFSFSRPSPVTVQQELTLDASASTGTGLLYRWDFEADGTWDTSWLTAATVRRRWCAKATYSVRLEVKDATGRLAQATRILEVTWFGQPSWVGVADNLDGDYAWWTVLGLDGARLSDTTLRVTGSSTYTEAYGVRQASDGRVLGTLQCRSSLLCDHNEIVTLGRGGKTGVFATANIGVDVRDLLELPDGNWLVVDKAHGSIVHADAQGRQLGIWASQLAGPSSLALTADGTGVLVALANGARIDRYSLAGAKQGRWDEFGHVATPHTIRRLSSGSYLVSDAAGKLVEFDAAGQFLGTTTGPSRIQVPTGLAELPDGRILFGETCTPTLDRCGSVKVLDRTAGTVGIWAPPANVSWVLWNPEGLLVVYE